MGHRHTRDWCTWMDFSLGKYTLVTETSGLLMAKKLYGPCQGRDNLQFLPVSSQENLTRTHWPTRN